MVDNELARSCTFLGENKEDEEDNGFAFKILNEIYTDKQLVPFGDLNELTFKEITKRSETGNADATNPINAITNYSLTVVLLSKSQLRKNSTYSSLG